MKEIVAPNYVRHMPGGVDFRGHEGYKKHVLWFITPFLDLGWNMDIMVSEEVVRTLFNSMANPLTNSDKVEITALEILRANTMMDRPAKTRKQANLSRSSPRGCLSSNAATS